MRTFSWLLVLILGFALVGCHRNLFTGMYSATAVAEIRFGGLMSATNTSYEERAAKEIITNATAEILSIESLDEIVHKLKLNRIWAQRFNSSAHDLSDQEAISHLRSVVKIDFPDGTLFVGTTSYGQLDLHPLIFKITAHSEVPQQAADIANGVADNYKAMRDKEEADRIKRGMDSLREQISEQQKVLEDARATAQKQPRDANSKLQLEQQQSLLDAMNIRLKQMIADNALWESPVRIISRAEPPPE